MYKSSDHFTIFSRNSGKKKVYYYYCYDRDGHRIKRTTGQHTKAAALDVIMDRIKKGALIADDTAPAVYRAVRKKGGITFAEFSSVLFVPGVCPLCRDKALRGKPYTKRVILENRRRIELHMLPFFGDMRLSEITVAELKRWMLWLHEEKGLANATINRTRSVMSLALSAAEDEGLIPSNPMRRVKALYVSSEGSKRPFTEAQVKAIFSVEWGSSIVRLACLLAAYTGMRVGEVRGLTTKKVKDGYVIVSESWSDKEKLKDTKSGRTRICPIPKEVEDELRRFSEGPDDLIFTLSGRAPISDSCINKHLYRAMAAAGITDTEGLSFHSFRYFFNSRLVVSGVAGEVIRSVIGHESEKMTERYLKLSDGDLGIVRSVQNTITAALS